MKKILFILLLLFIIGIIHDNMPANKDYEYTTFDYQIMQTTCERNHGKWFDDRKECFYK